MKLPQVNLRDLLSERLSALIRKFGDVLHIKTIHIQASGVRCQVSGFGYSDFHSRHLTPETNF